MCHKNRVDLLQKRTQNQEIGIRASAAGQNHNRHEPRMETESSVHQPVVGQGQHEQIGDYRDTQAQQPGGDIDALHLPLGLS